MTDKCQPNQDKPDFLSELNKDFKKSKAEQIVRLLKDQESLNDRFREFSLETDESDARTDEETGSNTDSDESIHETERKIAERISLRKHMGVRCKTSMGFYNNTEYDPDSGVESGIGAPSRDITPKLRPLRASNLNPRRRMYTPRTQEATIGLKLDLGDGLTVDEPIIESARDSRPLSGTNHGRRLLPSTYQEQRTVEPLSPATQDSCLRLRPRLSSAKIDPLYCQTPVKGFCDGRDGHISNQDEMPYTHGVLPPRSFTPKAVSMSTPSHLEHHSGRGLNRSQTIVDRGIRSNKYGTPARPYTPVEGSFHSRTDCRVMASGRPNVRRKLPDISKTKALAVMKLPPLESNVNKNVPTEKCSTYLKNPVLQTLGVDY